MTDTARLEVVRLRPGAHLPARESSLATGFDLHACVEGDPIEVESVPVLVPTGIAIAAPAGYDLQVRPRSGLSSRGVLAVLGTLDADYRGEVFVTLYRLPDTPPHTIHDGDRIAQLVVARHVEAEWVEVEVLDPTERGDRGHGSTGR